MPVDARIPLSVEQPKFDSPLKTMAELYAVKNASEELKGRQLMNTERDLENQKRTRDAADDAAIRQELANARTDPSGQLDVPGAIQRLHAGGHGTAGMKLTQQWQDHLKKQADTAKSEIDRHMADLEGGARLWMGVTDDNSLAVAKRAAPSIMGPDSQKLLENLPDDYASAKPQIDALLQAGNKMADKLKAAQDSVKDHQYALEHGLIKPDPAHGETEPPAVTETREKTKALMTSSAARMLAITENDQEYQRQLQSFKQQGYPDDVLNKFDTVWTPKAVAKAKALQLSEKEVEELRIQGKNADTAAKNATTAAAREEREKNGPKLDPWFSHDMQEYNAAKGEYDKNNPYSDKPFKLVPDPADPTGKKLTRVPNTGRKEFETFGEWRATNKQRGPDGSPLPPPQAPVQAAPPPPIQGRGAPPAGVVTPPPPAAAPPVAAAPPQAPAPVGAPVAPPQSPTLGANVRPGLPVPPPQAAAPPPPVAGATSEPLPHDTSVGDIVMRDGKQFRVSAIKGQSVSLEPAGKAPAVGQIVHYKGKRYKVAAIEKGQAKLEPVTSQ